MEIGSAPSLTESSVGARQTTPKSTPRFFSMVLASPMLASCKPSCETVTSGVLQDPCTNESCQQMDEALNCQRASQADQACSDELGKALAVLQETRSALQAEAVHIQTAYTKMKRARKQAERSRLQRAELERRVEVEEARLETSRLDQRLREFQNVQLEKSHGLTGISCLLVFPEVSERISLEEEK